MYSLLCKEKVCSTRVNYGKEITYVNDMDSVEENICLYEFMRNENILQVLSILYVRCKDGKWRIYNLVRRCVFVNVLMESPDEASDEELVKAFIDSYDLNCGFYAGYFALLSREDIAQGSDDTVKKYMEENNIPIFVPFTSLEEPVYKKHIHVKNMDEETGKKLMELFQFKSVRDANLASGIISDSHILVTNVGYEENAYCSKELFDWTKNLFAEPDDSMLRDRTLKYGILNVVTRTKESGDFFYVQTNDHSITISKIEGGYKQDENFDLVFQFKKVGELHYDIMRGNNYCKKYMTKSEKDISPFKLFNINTKNISQPHENYVFEDGFSVGQWFLENKDICKKTGFFDYVSSIRGNAFLTGSLVLYFSVVYEYPSIELLVKSGHIGLVEELFDSMKKAINKDVILRKVTELNLLVDKDATAGRMALRFPSYIGDYLKSIHAPFEAYIFWRDVYEIEHISKENFEKVINSSEFAMINMEMTQYKENEYYYFNTTWDRLGLPDIIKYPGYTIEKTIRYVCKQYVKLHFCNKKIFHSPSCHSNLCTLFDTLKDTLDMSDTLGIEVEPYPSNLLDVHKELAEVQNSIIQSHKDDILMKVAESCGQVFDKLLTSDGENPVKKMAKQFTCVFPKSQKDFTEEGIKQHNCVSGYSRHVANGTCVVFFVRIADKPDDSFVTVELRPNGLNQVMYSNNRPVSSTSNVYGYCKYIGEKICSFYERGELCIFKKVPLAVTTEPAE